MGEGALLRVVHASPDAPGVDVYAEGVATPLVSGLTYGEASTYLAIDPGTYNIQLRPAGAPSGSASVYQTGNLTLSDGDTITAVAVGLLAPGSAGQAFRVLALGEGFANPGSGNSAVRIVHGSPDAPTVPIDVGADGTPEIAALDRFADTGAAGIALPVGQAIRITIWAGSPLARVTSFTTPALPEGAELFVIATGLLADLPREENAFSLLAIGPSGAIGFIPQDPTVFALHASPDAPTVDIYAGGALLIDDLSFGDLSGAVQVPPGSYNLEFRVATSGQTAATLSTPALEAGERYLAVATGFAGQGSLTLLPARDDLLETAGGARVAVVHASPDAPAVDVGVVSGSAFTPIADFTGLAYGDVSPSQGTSVPAASLTLGVAATGQPSPVATFDVTTSAGLRAFAVAAGSLAGSGESFHLVLVVASVFPWTSAEVLPN